MGTPSFKHHVQTVVGRPMGKEITAIRNSYGNYRMFLPKPVTIIGSNYEVSNAVLECDPICHKTHRI